MVNKPIEVIHIDFSGDPSVGISPSHFEATVWIDPSCVPDEDWQDWMEDIRRDFQNVYADMMGEEPRVLFDFEVEQIQNKIPEEES